jgi:hypothetical protein
MAFIPLVVPFGPGATFRKVSVARGELAET